MGFTNFPNGVSSMGTPLVGGGRFGSPWATHYFIDGINGSDTGNNNGKDPTHAFATIQQFFTASTAGDVGYIRPKAYTLGTGFARYTEDVSVTLGGSGGSGATATNANKTLIGITPCIVPTDFLGVRWKYATSTQLTVDAPGLHLENIGFFTEDGTYCINLRNNGATRTQEGTTGFSMYNCAVKGDAKVYGNGANELQIVHCRFQAKYDGTVGGINLVGSSNQVVRPIIRDCEFIGGNGNAMTAAPIQGAAPWHNAVIRDCYFDDDTDTGQYITISGTTSTGIIANMYCGSGDISTTSFDSGGIEVVAAYDDDGIQNGADA